MSIAPKRRKLTFFDILAILSLILILIVQFSPKKELSAIDGHFNYFNSAYGQDMPADLVKVETNHSDLNLPIITRIVEYQDGIVIGLTLVYDSATPKPIGNQSMAKFFEVHGQLAYAEDVVPAWAKAIKTKNPSFTVRYIINNYQVVETK